MATTTYFGWTTPDNTDLVKDGASAIRSLGSQIDASLQDLEGGTSGQILSKNSNTDMDFVWINNDQGDITAVTAGTGISGGGTSGAVTITNSMATAIDAKGDLIGGTGADTFARLAVGANGTVLTADSAETTGLKWATPSSGGKLLQMVSATYSTSTTIASTSYTDTGLTATITPTLATSKILILITTNVYANRSANQMGVSVKILRGATSIFESAVAEQADFDAGSLTSVEKFRTLSFNYVDSPNTTSATIYKLQGAAQTTANSGTTTWQKNSQVVTMTLLEIGA